MGTVIIVGLRNGTTLAHQMPYAGTVHHITGIASLDDLEKLATRAGSRVKMNVEKTLA